MPNKERGAPRLILRAIRDAIVEVIKDDPPMTVRQVFYQLVSRGVIEKTEEQYQGTVIRLMTEMRLDGSLPYSSVVMRAAASGSRGPMTALSMRSSRPRSSIGAAR